MTEAKLAWDEIIRPYGKKLMKEKGLAEGGNGLVDFEQPLIKAEKKRSEKDGRNGLVSCSSLSVDVSISELLRKAEVSEAACCVLDCVVVQTDGAMWDNCSALLEVLYEERDDTGNIICRWELGGHMFVCLSVCLFIHWRRPGIASLVFSYSESPRNRELALVKKI